MWLYFVAHLHCIIGQRWAVLVLEGLLLEFEPIRCVENRWNTQVSGSLRPPVSYCCPCCRAEFTQGMILPTANGVAKPPPPSQPKAKQDKTQVCVCR